MKGKLSRILGLVLLTSAFSVVSVRPASADFWASWFWGGASGTPECMFAGTNIITGVTPDKHNATSANACETDFDVKVSEVLKNSSDNDIASCTRIYASNYRQCNLQHATDGGAGEYWWWRTFIHDNAGGEWWIPATAKDTRMNGVTVLISLMRQDE